MRHISPANQQTPISAAKAIPNVECPQDAVIRAKTKSIAPAHKHVMAASERLSFAAFLALYGLCLMMNLFPIPLSVIGAGNVPRLVGGVHLYHEGFVCRGGDMDCAVGFRLVMRPCRESALTVSPDTDFARYRVFLCEVGYELLSQFGGQLFERFAAAACERRVHYDRHVLGVHYADLG